MAFVPVNDFKHNGVRGEVHIRLVHGLAPEKLGMHALRLAHGVEIHTLQHGENGVRIFIRQRVHHKQLLVCVSRTMA